MLYLGLHQSRFMRFLLRILITSLAALLAAYLIPGVHIADYLTAVFLALVLALMNTFLKPVLIFLTLPMTVLTLGLFLLVINALIVLMASHFVKGFRVDGFWSALLFSILLSLFSSILDRLGGRKIA